MTLKIALGIALAFSIPEKAIENAATASHALRLAVVIPDGADEEARLCGQVNDRLSTLLRSETGKAEAMALECLSGTEASTRLRERRCDAVIVLGSARPSALRGSDMVAYAASLSPEYGLRPAYLVMRNHEAQGKSLVAVFPHAMRTLGRPAE